MSAPTREQGYDILSHYKHGGISPKEAWDAILALFAPVVRDAEGWQTEAAAQAQACNLWAVSVSELTDKVAALQRTCDAALPLARAALAYGMARQAFFSSDAPHPLKEWEEAQEATHALMAVFNATTPAQRARILEESGG